MSSDWLLTETLGSQIVVAAQGRQPRKLIPIAKFLHRNQHAASIVEAVTTTYRSGAATIVQSTNGNRVIHAEPVTMTDGRVHGVQVWTGPSLALEPPRPAIGAAVWDLFAGTVADTPTALLNSGLDPATQLTHRRTLAEILPIGDIQPDESRVLSLAMKYKPGETICATWQITTHSGEIAKVSVTARAALESFQDGTQHLIARAMNWQSPGDTALDKTPHLAEQILRAMAQDGVHRAIVAPETYNILKWLDPPCPFFDWRGEEGGRPIVHPDDQAYLRFLRIQSADSQSQGVVRLRSTGGWTPIHVTIYRIALDTNTHVGVVAARLPTSSEQNLCMNLGEGA